MDWMTGVVQLGVMEGLGMLLCGIQAQMTNSGVIQFSFLANNNYNMSLVFRNLQLVAIGCYSYESP